MAAEARREPRTRVMMQGRLRARGPEHDACLLDVSSRGLLMTADLPPPRGSFIEVRVNRHSLVGQVEWAEARRFGVVLQDRIDTDALIRGGDEITLKGRATAQSATYRAARASAPDIARIAQFAVLALAGFGAALVVAHTVQQQLSPLQQAKAAMAGTRPR
ncbi:MAG: PilZ domain-containing protein [Sphingomonadales bacterium]|nr:PilZ domain-containing protein [Sphingomonadales bacterium]